MKKHREDGTPLSDQARKWRAELARRAGANKSCDQGEAKAAASLRSKLRSYVFRNKFVGKRSRCVWFKRSTPIGPVRSEWSGERAGRPGPDIRAVAGSAKSGRHCWGFSAQSGAGSQAAGSSGVAGKQRTTRDVHGFSHDCRAGEAAASPASQ